MRGAGKSIRLTYLMAVLSATCAGLSLSGQALAQEQTESSEPQAKYFSLDQLDVYLEFEGQYDRSRVRRDVRNSTGLWRPRNQLSQTNHDLNLEERLGFRLDGMVVDPSFITYDAELSFALTQDRYKEYGWSGDETESDTGHLLLYDVRLNLLQGKPFSGSVYAQRRDNRISRRFQPTLDEERTAFGTSWVFSDEKTPMELSYDYVETDRVGNWDKSDDEHFTESNFHYGLDWIISGHEKFSFSYEHAENKQEYQGSRNPFDTTRDLFTAEHEYEFGADQQHSLRTLMHWQEESGDFARDLFEIGPQLTLQHSDNLQTMYKYQYNREVYEGFDVDTHRADFQLVHQLYSNLTTTVDLFGLYENTDEDVDTTQYGGSVDWQYNRKNAYGRLYANLALAYDTECARGDNGARLVLNEAGTFNDPQDIILRNRNVLPYSIVVTDITGARLYRVGVDYFILRSGNVTRLRRISTGQIADGDTVLVDYHYATPSDGQIDTIRTDFAIEQRFDCGLTPYYRFSYRNQEAESSTGFARYQDRTDHHRIGARYEQDKYTLGAEFEIYDDTIEPYDAFHIDGMYHILQTPEHTVDASCRFSRFYFDGGWDNRDVSVLDVELDHRWRLRDDLSTFERLAYRWEDDSIDGRTHAWDVTAGLDYVLGDFNAQLTLEYDRLALPESTEDEFGVYLRLRREIPNVLANW